MAPRATTPPQTAEDEQPKVNYPNGLILRGKVDKHLQQQYTARKDKVTGKNRKRFPVPHLCRDRTEINWNPTVSVFDSDAQMWYIGLAIHSSVSHQPKATKTKSGRAMRATFNRTRHIIIPGPVKRGLVLFEFRVDGAPKQVTLTFGCKQPSTKGGNCGAIYFLMVDPDEHAPMNEGHAVMAEAYAVVAARDAAIAGKYAVMANEHGPMAGVHAAMAEDYAVTARESAVLAEVHAAAASEHVPMAAEYAPMPDPDEYMGQYPMGEGHTIMAEEYAAVAVRDAATANKYAAMANEHGPMAEVHAVMAKDYTVTAHESAVLTEVHTAAASEHALMAAEHAPMAAEYAPMAVAMAEDYAPMAADYPFMAVEYAPMAADYPLMAEDHAAANDDVVHCQAPPSPPMVDAINENDATTDFDMLLTELLSDDAMFDLNFGLPNDPFGNLDFNG